MKVRKFFLALASVLASAAVYAQSATEIQMAKQLAKQQGYSDAQIEAMMNQYNKGGNTPAEAVQAIDRNASAREQMQMAKSVATNESNGAETVYGHNLFKNKSLNFVPSYNIPTPANYKLSAGDELVIDIWGDAISNITSTISPDGSINIPNLGPVYVAGQTVEKAEKSLKSYLSKIYSGIAQDEPTTFVKLALGKTKTVTVNVVGDVEKPGSYTLPALSTIASAMYLAEGPNDLGTIRAINLYPNGKVVSSFDVYEFIAKGTFNSNVKLEDNDVISVAPYAGIVR